MAAWYLCWTNDFQVPDDPAFRKGYWWMTALWLPLKISCSARYSLAIEVASTAVTWHLSSELAMGIIFSPAWCMVHSLVGTSGMPKHFLNLCKVCGWDFSSIRAFPLHVTHPFEQLCPCFRDVYVLNNANKEAISVLLKLERTKKVEHLKASTIATDHRKRCR